MSDSLWPHGLQHTRLPCPSPTPRACSNSCPLSQWCYPSISSSLVPFSFLQSFPASGFFKWVSSSHQIAKVLELQVQHVLPVSIQDWFHLGLSGLISLQSKGLSRVFSSTTSWKHLDLSLKAQRLYSFFRSFRNWNRINRNVHFSPILRKEKFFYLW